ncbi:SDR family NAD(P)-dependent oxidoreductase [Micromonospora sp. HUAS LYJ1]|uniref:SDR family NAD(P)-dependent oxidoreductase n=1 Tax=Micromonospora sp. HUAS LYJ1 TaxID=3061626 RepID=UPI002673F925|nr:SDR family NAD(P)-dependent oxidoreductase [Micromonospora sp. HUAS LYJ1]WKU03551.1 SDR family NAD(P)-dependent oxidoreductase [Micromonospora sp. HUAS LYJ1]
MSATSRLDGRCGIVTGSSRGLGRAFACHLARQGMAVVVNGTDPAAVDEVVTAITRDGGTATAVLGSVAEEPTWDALVDACRSLGSVDLLVNNAGILRDRSVLKMAPEDFDAVVAVHLRGTWGCSTRVAREMRTGGGGSIVSIGSGSGLFGMFGQANYAAAKAGIVGLNRVLDLELTRYGIRCNVLCPVARTDMTSVLAGDGPSYALEFPDPNHVAPILPWLASEAAEHVRGQVISFDGEELGIWSHPQRAASGGRPCGTWTAEDFGSVVVEASLQQPHPDRWGRGAVTA